MPIASSRRNRGCARAARELPRAVPVVGWAVDPQRVLRPPSGVRHVVLDTPGGLRGFELARVAACADAILVPVGPSSFDREASAACVAELMALPRVASGACKVATVGMRIDARTRAAEALAAWAADSKVTFVGVLRETQVYVRCAESGLGVFDLAGSAAAADIAQWQPILAWLDKALREVKRPVVGGERVVPKALPAGSVRGSLPMAPATRVSPAAPPPMVARPLAVAREARPARRSFSGLLAACIGWWPSPRVAHR